MRVLIVAPGMGPPWTEGRKNFLRELLPELAEQFDLMVATVLLKNTFHKESVTDYPIPTRVFTTASKLLQMPVLLHGSARVLREYDPDLVLHCPYGTFDGARGYVNHWACKAVRELAGRHGKPSMTFFYSVTEGNLNSMAHRFGPLACVPTNDWTGASVFPGSDTQRLPLAERAHGTRNLLFMAGYQENSRRQLNNILGERGLADVLGIGQALARAGCQLTIAIPLLRYQRLRRTVEQLCERDAPDLPVRIDTQGDPRNLLLAHDLYLFPYKKNLRIFLPTSVVEATAIGIPTVLPALPMLSALDAHGAGSLHHFYPPGDRDAFTETILQALESNVRIGKQRLEEVARARKAWHVRESARQLVACIAKVVEEAEVG